MTNHERNRAWLERIRRRLLSLPPGERTGSVTLHFSEAADTAVIRHLDWHRREARLDSTEADSVD